MAKPQKKEDEISDRRYGWFSELHREQLIAQDAQGRHHHGHESLCKPAGYTAKVRELLDGTLVEVTFVSSDPQAPSYTWSDRKFLGEIKPTMSEEQRQEAELRG